MTLDADELGRLLSAVALTRDTELDCDACLSEVGRFAEAELAGKRPDDALERVHQHLAICADCREEYEALLLAMREVVPNWTGNGA